MSIFLWVTTLCFPFFWLLKRFGLFRLSKEIEVIGTDVSEMGGMPQWLYEKLRHQYSNKVSPLASMRKDIGNSDIPDWNEDEKKPGGGSPRN